MAPGHPAWHSRPYLLISCVLLILILPNSFGVSVPSGEAPVSVENTWQHVLSSWALGVVIPDGARFEGGGTLSWTSARNLTVMVHLPNITTSDEITYIVLSAMGNDRTVLQVAAGIYPGSNHWSIYSWFITDVDSASPAYEWVLNSSAPEMRQNDVISISIIVTSPPGWKLTVDDENTSSSLERAFPSVTAVSFASGDQEVFAFESYSRNDSTFQQMGNMTLESLLINGKKVVGGWYSYSGWDAIHNPLFVVGSSNPPPFVSISLGAHGEATWSYAARWTSTNWNVPPFLISLCFLLLGCLVLLAYFVRRRLRRVQGRLGVVSL